MRTIINGKPTDTWSDENILICPYCGKKIKVDFETFPGDDLDTSEDIECPECEKTFTATRTCHFSYETYKQNDGETVWDDDNED